MSAATIFTGPGTPERCREAHEAMANRTGTIIAIARDLGVNRSTLKRMVAAHESMRTYSVKLQRAGSPSMLVCQVVTPKGALAAAVAAFREYPGTMKNLELPGWQLVAGDASFELSDVAKASGSRRAA